MTLDTSTNRSRIENLSSEHNLRGVYKSSAIPFFLGSYYEFKDLKISLDHSYDRI